MNKIEKEIFDQSEDVYLEAIKQVANEQCPNGYHMSVRNQGDWGVISTAVNQGIDSYLEAFTKSTFDSSTGECNIHPDELHILFRRLSEDPSERAEDLLLSIMQTLS